MQTIKHTKDNTVFVDLLKLGLLFNPLTHIENPHPLWTHNAYTGRLDLGLSMQVGCEILQPFCIFPRQQTKSMAIMSFIPLLYVIKRKRDVSVKLAQII